MAREIKEIRDQLVSDFVSNTVIQEVYELTPGQSFDDEFSKVSLEAILFFTIATAIYSLEKLFDIHKEWIENRAKELKGGSLAWYVSISKMFQYGDSLVFSEDMYQYATVNEDNQIVKLAAAVETGNQILLKVANINSSGDVVKLSTGELDSFKAYIKKVKYAGVNVLAVSRDADDLRINYRVYIDALTFSANGSLILDPNSFPVEDAINEFIQNLDFNGVFSITKLTDAIQLKSGVLNPVFETAQVKYGTNAYTSFTDYYTPNAGYLKVDAASPLNTTITYILQ